MYEEPESRYGHSAVFCNGLVYLWGGVTSTLPKTHDGPEKKKLMSKIFLFSTTTASWVTKTASGNSPLSVRDFAAVAYGSDRLLQFGGYCGHDYCLHNSLHTLYIANCDTFTWEELVPDFLTVTTSSTRCVPMMKQDCGIVCYDDASSGSAMLVVFGGAGCRSNKQKFLEATNEVHVMHLSGSECEWTVPVVSGHPPPPCHGFSFVKINERQVMLFGGRIGREVNGPLSNQLYSLALDSLTWSQIEIQGPEWPKCCESHASSFTGRHLLIFGGMNKNSVAVEEAWSYDLITSSWKQLLGEVPLCFKERACHTVSRLSVNDEGTAVSLMVFGGVKRYIRGEQQNKQPMMAHTVVMNLVLVVSGEDDCTCWAIDYAFDLSYMGRQVLSVVKKCGDELATKDREVNELRKQLAQANSEIHDLKKFKTETKHSVHQMYSQLSLDQHEEQRPPSDFKGTRSHSLPTGSSSMDKHSLDKNLTNLDMKTILEAIDELTDWYVLGIALGLSPSTLDSIGQECDNVFRCKSRVIQSWLNHTDKCEQSTWRVLMEAVSGTLMKNHALAQKIEDHYVIH